MSVEYWGNAIDRGKTKVVGENPVPVPLFPPQISHGLGSNSGLHDERPMHKCLSHGTVSEDEN